MNSKKGLGLIIIIILAVGVVIAAGILFVSKKDMSLNINNKGNQEVTQTQPPEVSAIENNSGLDAAAVDLDDTDLNQIDNELNQLDSETSDF